MAAIYGLALFGAALAGVLVFFVVSLAQGPELEMPAWIGSAAVTTPMWVAVLLWLQLSRLRRAAVAVPTVALAVVSVVPVDASWTASLGIALLTGLCLALVMWFMSGVQRWLALDETTAVIILILMGPIVGFAVWQLIESEVVATWTVVTALALAGLLGLVTVLAIDRPFWRSRRGWYRPAAYALVVALALNGMAGLATAL